MMAVPATKMSSRDDYLDSLNKEQRSAVEHANGPLLIFAGAGSGKTRVLTHRIAHLVLEHGVRPNSILAVTFTNKAAREMKHRVSTLFSGGAAPNWVATFHAMGVRILREHAQLLDYTKSFVIYDSNDSLSAIKRVYKRLNIDPKALDPRMVRSRIDKAKNNYLFADSILNDTYTPEPVAEMIAQVYEHYQQELHRSNAMDFGDLLCNVVTLFKLEPAVLERYQEKFEHVLIDEYQDTNKVQYMLMRMLVQNHNNICVVGDDDQSIYAFRGATIENILNFRNDFPEAKVVTLEQNYRSTKTILQAATSIISRNKRRQSKTLRTENEQGNRIIGYKAFDEHEEAYFVVQEIAALLSKGTKPEDIAIFYRTNAQSRAIEEALIENDIAYEIFGGHRFYERKEIKDILAYLKLLINPADDEALLRVINTPTRGIGAKSIGNLVAYAQERKLPIISALREALSDGAPFIKGAAGKKFRAFSELIDSLNTDCLRAQQDLLLADNPQTYDTALNALASLLHQIATKSTYLERLKTEDSIESESRIENIFELMNVAKEFVKNSLSEERNPSISDFLDRASLTSDLDQENTKHSEQQQKLPVSLMTLHLAKGLEFDVVIMLGMEEGLLPHVRSLEDPRGLEEERRLCYVGITRARKQLYLTRARSRQGYGASGFYGGIPSRFLEDLPPERLDDRHTGFLETYL